MKSYTPGVSQNLRKLKNFWQDHIIKSEEQTER